MPLNLIFTQPGNFTIDDNGIPGDNTSVIRDGNGVVIFTFLHPVDSLGFTVSVPGVHLTINFTNSMGAADFSIGDLTNAAITPDSIVMRSVLTTGDVTLVSNGTITEGGADAAADIVAGTLIMSAVSGVGTAGNAIETQTGLMEVETITGGINIGNTGSVQIGGLTDQVNGLDVLTFGDLSFTAIGSIFLSDLDLDTVTNPPNSPAETVHGGSTSGNVTLAASGLSADIITNTDTDAISAPRGNITLDAGRDVAFGTIGVDFDNDVRANGTVLVNAGRDFLLDGFSDLSSDDFFNNTGGGVIINTGRNIHLRNIAGSDATVTASGSVGADVTLTTGFGGALILDAPSTTALGSNSGAVIVNADRVQIGAASGITASSGSVTIQQRTAGWSIDLGSATDAAFALEISDAEFDRIFTPTLNIGSFGSGSLRVSSAVTPAGATNLHLRAGTDIRLDAGLTVTTALSLSAGDNIYQIAASAISAGGAVSAFVDLTGDDGGLGGLATLNGTMTASTVTLSGNGEIDMLNGSGAGETINGGAGNDILRGFGGNDTLIGGLGLDTMDGGLGNDFFFVDNSSDVVIEAIGGGSDRIFASASFVLGAGAEVEILSTTNNTGTDAINLKGNEFANLVAGNNGANILDGGAGADILNGLAGNDFYYVDNAGDVVLETIGNGSDRILSSVSYVLGAGAEVEILSTTNNAGTDAINLKGNEFANLVAGNNGANILDGGAGADTLNGLAGNDFYYVDNAGDVVLETIGNGSDRILSSVSYVLGAGAEVEILSTTNNTGTDAINLTGNALVNLVAGNNGANLLDGGAGADTLNGLAGNDFFLVDNAGDVVIEAIGGGSDRIFASVSYVLGAGVEVEILSTTNNAGTDPINLKGNEFANIVAGNNGANLLDGGAGADTLNGLAGNDFFLVDNAADMVLESAGGGSDRIFASASFVLGAGAEVEILSTTNNTGTDAINLKGNEFANLVAGNNGANILDGGAGADILNGLAGNDFYYVDNAGDVVLETIGNGSDRILSSVSYVLGAGAEVEILSTTNNAGTDAINLKGNEFANLVAGNNGANILDGGAGADILNGLAGNDFYYVDNAGDVVLETIGNGSDRILSSVSYVLSAGVEVEILSTTNNTGTDAIDLTGNEFANTLAGNDGANVLNGGGGSDILNGLGGADTYRFTTAIGVGNIDTILGYVVADDVIQLEDSLFVGLAAGALAAGAFNTGAAASEADDRIIYNSATGALLFDADGNGAGAALQFATLDGGLAITASEFFVI